MEEKKEKIQTTSKILPYKDHCRSWHKTRISYQFARVEGKEAMKYFIDNKYIDTKLKEDTNNKDYFTFYPYGGQELPAAQFQREECLMTICTHLFEKLGFTIQIEPNLDVLTPDMLIQKDGLDLYIELKAYTRDTIVGDPEITQTMKYFEMAQRLHQLKIKKMERSPKIKAILVTTGKLINFNQSVFSKTNAEMEAHVQSFYDKFISPRRQAKTLDELSSRSIYVQAVKKLLRNIKIGLNPMNTKFMYKANVSKVKEILFEPNEFEVIAFNADIFHQFLIKEGMTKEAEKFDLIRDSSLEELIINRHLLEF